MGIINKKEADFLWQFMPRNEEQLGSKKNNLKNAEKSVQ